MKVIKKSWLIIVSVCIVAVVLYSYLQVTFLLVLLCFSTNKLILVCCWNILLACVTMPGVTIARHACAGLQRCSCSCSLALSLNCTLGPVKVPGLLGLLTHLQHQSCLQKSSSANSANFMSCTSCWLWCL